MENFVQAVRDAGYLSLSTALAELVDNSIEAEAHRIDINISKASGQSHPEVRVVDDGHGMTASELRDCLRFGGTSRFNRRESFGRFGMGLPTASLSQARRVDVVSWAQGLRPGKVTLDVDEVGRSCAGSCLTPEDEQYLNGASGCAITWTRCDRIEGRRIGSAEKAVRRDLGRMYRHFLADGLTITLNGVDIEPVDPLMLATVIDGHSAEQVFDTLTYGLAAPEGACSTVTVRFSLLPVAAWHGLDNATKKQRGIVGDGGVSVLRAGREVARGWYLMGAKRKENYDDWWRCEISFEPALDEYFGITINKQGIRPTQTLRDALEPQLETIARMLNAKVRQLFEDVKFQEATQASCRIAAAADCDLPVIEPGRCPDGPLAYRIGSQPLPDATMFHTDLKGRTLNVTFNVDHPAFTALYRPLQTRTDGSAIDLRTAIELLVLSFARTTALLGRTGTEYESLLSSWSAAYGRMLQRT